MPPTKQHLDEAAWKWAENVDPGDIANKHIEMAYRINLQPCKRFACRRNCKGNPHCMNALGESKWFSEIPDDNWYEIEDPEEERREKNAFAGLVNLGATCYVNTFLQVWFHNPDIRKAVFSWQDSTTEETNLLLKQDMATLKNSMTDEELEKLLTPQDICGHLQNVFALLQFSQRRYIDPTPFIKTLGLDADLQQDEQEFSKLFMTLLEDTLDQQQDFEAKTFTHRFMGQYHYVTRCCTCGSESRRSSSFYELDLNIKGNNKLFDCIEEFLKEEKLEGDNQYMCVNCGSKQNAVRSIQLQALPKVLNLQLLRFVFDRKTLHRKKLVSFIEFPETLDMSPYLKESGTRAVYDLAAVLIHKGNSAHKGHYVAHIKDTSTNTWYKCNDEEIEKIGGKNLKLGNEEEEIDDRSSKKPRIERAGHHVSKNAYMLVYHLRQPSENGSFHPSGSSSASSLAAPSRSDSEKSLMELKAFQPSMLSLRVQRYLEFDNDRFEKWVADIRDMREKNAGKGRARQKEIQQVFSALSFIQDDVSSWVPTSWLMKFMSCDSPEAVPQIDNKSLLCRHKKLDPEKVPYAKCISKTAADLLFSKYGINVIINRKDVCVRCVKEKCHVIRVKTRINEDNKAITAFMKSKEELRADDCYWVGKLSLRSWKRLALERLEDYQSLSKTSNYSSSELITNKGASSLQSTSIADHWNSDSDQQGCEEAAAKAASSSQDTATAAATTATLKFNQEILCEKHNCLSLRVASRKLVPKSIWVRFQQYFPNAPEYLGNSAVCSACQEEVVEEEKQNCVYKTIANEQKMALHDLYLDRKRPNWMSSGSIQVNVITKHFLDSWRKFIRDPSRNDPVEETDNKCLLCPHGGFVFNPHTIGLDFSSQRFCLLYEEEWLTIKRFMKTDIDITITRIEEKTGDVSFCVTPEICHDCREAFEYEELKSKLNFKNKTIYVRRCESAEKLETVKRYCSPMDTDEDVRTVQSACQYDNADNAEDAGASKKWKSFSEAKMPSVTLEYNRRITRHHKAPGEREFSVSSLDTLKELKIQIMQEFAVAPFDQKLLMDGHLLKGDKNTLKSLHVMPGAVLYLQEDEPVESIEDDSSQDSHPEAGFKGTGLLNR